MASTPVFGNAVASLEFRLIDQFGEEQTQDDVAGQVTILIGGNRKASEHSRDWALAIQSFLETRTDQVEEIAVLSVADLRGIPRMLEPAVATQLGKKYERSVLMDWDGQITGEYEFAPRMANVVVIDKEGEVVHQLSGKQPQAAQLGELARALSKLTTSLKQECPCSPGSVTPQRFPIGNPQAVHSFWKKML